MTTAISVDDALMAEADQAAHELGLSRSALVAEALREYLKKRSEQHISEQLNHVYANVHSREELVLVRKFKTRFPVLDPW